MKKIILITVLLSSSLSFAGSCELVWSSKEPYHLDWFRMKVETIENVSLQTCFARARAVLGVHYRGRTIIRNEERLINLVDYEYSDHVQSSKGAIALK